ncbi:hypothetical protein ACFL6H_02795 [Candidatus Latescibacterota bacterium]
MEEEKKIEDFETWYDKVANMIDQHRFIFSMSDPEKNPVNFMVRVTRKVADYSGECAECESYKDSIYSLAEELKILHDLPPEKRKKPFNKLKPIVKHLQKEHNLVTQNQYTSAGLAFGLVGGSILGLVAGTAIGNPGMGFIVCAILGTGLGMQQGYSKDQKAKEAGKII